MKISIFLLLAKQNIPSIFSENRCISGCLYLSHQMDLHQDNHYLCYSSPKWNLLPSAILYKPTSTRTLSNFSHPFMDTYRCNTHPAGKKGFIMCLLSSHCYKLLIGDYTERRVGKGGSAKQTAHNHSASSKTLHATFFCGQLTKVMDVMSSEVRRAASLCSAQSAPGSNTHIT